MCAQEIHQQVNLGGFKGPLTTGIGRIANTGIKGMLIGASIGTALGAILGASTALICRNQVTPFELKPYIFFMGMTGSIAYPVVGTGVGLIAGTVTQMTREIFNSCRYLIR